MKCLFKRIFTAIVLVFSIVFGANLLTSIPVSAVNNNTPTYETPENTPGNNTPSEGETTYETPENTPGNTSPNGTTYETPENTPGNNNEENSEEKTVNLCEDQTGALGWVVCPTSGLIAKATDALYGAIEDTLIVTPLSMDQSSPIYLTWQYARSITNIVFAIFLIIVIYSQLTGVGLNNYGLKRVLPRLIIAVILVNLSFIICSIAVDVSNIVGASLREFFTSIETNVIAGTEVSEAAATFSLSDLLAVVISGGTIAGVAISAVGGGGYIFFMLLVVLLGAIVSVVSGIITIAARQALVALLVMISPLAFVAYLLPNTERWFNKWKDLLTRMLVFYPMFSFLFGASHLVGYSLVASANSPFGVILGIAVQIFPLFFSWSLMKMSGTVLGTLNQGIRRLSMPLQRSSAGWALSHAEQARQHHLANSTQTGAHLRRYLDSRRELRELDTRNSMQIRKGRALESAYHVASSSKERRADGRDDWHRRANRYTTNAKYASYHETRANTAAAAYRNTLSGFGSHFEGDEVTNLAKAHGEAYLDAMAQQFLSVNEAQADQEWLLNQYIDAQSKINTDSYQYNRLVKSAAGGLGHTGESSIMGQVIIGNSQIENRRRSEGRIMITKFGIQKPTFRAMVFDANYIDDNGIKTDAAGNALEDNQYQLKEGKHYTPWQQYIGVHKVTGEEISKDQYDSLSDTAKKNYRRVKYFDIVDDKGNPVQRVYDDDAGYMKELLRDDIAIGDPINRRYLTEIGVGRGDERDGILRKYHSTISAAMLETRYKDHAAEVTPMITAQTNMGYVRSIGQYNIANLQSLTVASKPGSFLQNDAYAISDWGELISSYFDSEKFAKYFPDKDIMGYLNVNGKELPGYELGTNDETGDPEWKKLTVEEMKAHKTPEEILELRKNYIRHKILPGAAKKLIGMADRNLSPNLIENQKPDTMAALVKLAEILADMATKNNDTSVDFADLPDGNTNLFDVKDAGALRRIFNAARQAQAGNNGDSGDTPTDNPSGGNPSSPNGGNGGGGNSGGNGGSGGPRPIPSGGTSIPHGSAAAPAPATPRPATRPGTTNFIDQLHREDDSSKRYDERNSLIRILGDIDEICDSMTDVEPLAAQISAYFNEVECLQPLVEECNAILDMYLYESQSDTTSGAIDQITHRAERERQRIELIRAEIKDLIQNQAQTT